MVERRICSFCGENIEPGTGRMYIKKDGTAFTFCNSKCRKNMLKLNRTPRFAAWTSYHVKGIKKEEKKKEGKAEKKEEKNKEEVESK